MSHPENVNSFVGRLATFESPRQLSKRHASSSKKRTATTVSWPHETPSPEDLARAGFYYAPDTNHPDNVVCFMCDSKLDGWEPEDVPALEHLSHAPACAWAINSCIPLRDADENEDPMSEQMVAARAATFAGSWPHENRKGWKCKTKKMVEAGWCYDPSPDYEDGVACFYCMLSLDGWEPKDDPKEEHYRRSPDCPFFMLIDVYAGARKATKGKKGRASTTSKASRLSVQSTRDFDTFSEAPSLMSLGDDAPLEGDSVLTTASNATTASMARGKKGAAKAKAATKNTRKTNRGKKAAEEPSVVEIEPPLDLANADLSLGDLNATDGDSAMTTATTASKAGKGRKTATKAKPAKGTRKTSRTTKKAAVADSTLLDEPTAEPAETEMEIEPAHPPSRTTRRTSKPEAPSYIDQASQLEPHAESEPSKPRTTRAKGGRKAKTAEESRLSNDASQLQSELEDAVTRAVQEEPAKSNRGSKRTSDGAVKTDDSVVVLEEPPKPTKAKRGRKAKQVEEAAARSEHETGDIENMPPPKPTTQPKRGRKAKEVVEESTVEAIGEEPRREPTPPPREPTPVHDSPEPAAEPSPEPSPEAAKEPTPAPREPTPPPQEITPSPSPQSSDAENRPPSSRVASLHAPPSARAPLSSRGTRVPLADASTPQASPSKRSGNVIGGLSSTQPWETVDLENIFLQSPAAKRGFHDNGEARDKENGSNWEELSLDEAILKVRREITSAEKKMTVEQWVQHQAEKGEQQLREQCERMVNIFETQGTKAMRALEGIRCTN
ncbi:Protein bir1 [Lasiodiplodia hormozganensis]|uniref:Protein bir1 n=1 Tax=Lasiodiplodia hormozganensis TaxID=869390 RepID=A0AA39YKU4_9PEZI|nr:Protein bir1 [Lasiodiplodia hormozganensis]